MKMLLWLAVAFVLGSLGDGVITLYAVGQGYAEQNPIVASIAGTWAFPALKLGGSILLAGATILVGRRFYRLAAGTLGIGSVYLVAVFATNLHTLGVGL